MGKCMKKCITQSKGFFNPAGAYSPAVVAEGKFVFVSGQGPSDPLTGKVVRGTLEEQFELTMKNIEAHLAAAGTTLANVVQCRVYLSNTDRHHWERMNAVYNKWFPDRKPARTTIGCQLMEIDVEIDVVAVVE